MKLNWFSPVPPNVSSGARLTAALLPVLAKQATVTLWVNEGGSATGLEQYARVVLYDPNKMPWAEINSAEATVYHLGSDEATYGPIWRVNGQHPGIVILHDSLPAGLARQNAISTVVHTGDADHVPTNAATPSLAIAPVFVLREADTTCNANAHSMNERAETVEKYAERLLEIVEVSFRYRARHAVRWMAERTGRAMKPWFSENAAGVLIIGVAQTVSSLFDERSLNTSPSMLSVVSTSARGANPRCAADKS